MCSDSMGGPLRMIGQERERAAGHKTPVESGLNFWKYRGLSTDFENFEKYNMVLLTLIFFIVVLWKFWGFYERSC